ncbi:MAG: FAD-dependent thymidylate synthase [Sporomusaceae bacterium]|jgi:thymidylate synthase (FAD)|nr:FAD-dependent thymidylate synthase [Sporomusaceae bacterium]
MQIKLLSISPDFLKTIWIAARTCYSPESPIEISEQEMAEREMLRLARHVISQEHHSVLEHCQMTYAVKNVSRTLLAQYSRHRIAVSLSVQSQRYVNEQSAKNEAGLFDFIIPRSAQKSAEAQAVFLDAMRCAQTAYDKLVACGVAREDARFVLPGAAGTNFVTSLNLRSFLDIYKKRVLHKGAQWEIREMILTMKNLLVEKEPWLAEYFAE